MMSPPFFELPICASTDKGLRQTLCPSSLTPSSKDVGRESGIAQQDHDLIQGLRAPHTVSVSFPTNPGSSLKSSREPKTAKMLKSITSALCITALVLAHSDHNAQSPIQGPHQSLWYKAFNTIPGDGGTQVRRLTLVHHIDPELDSVLQALDKVLAASICSSRKVRFSGGYNVPLDENPFNSWAKVLDCGDIPVTSYDNAYAIQQIEEGHNALLTRLPFTNAKEKGFSKSGLTLPRIITLGGDHTITLPLLRSVTAAYGPISVIHFDSHLDTWRPRVFGGAPTAQAAINHGTYFYHAHAEGLLANDSNIHAGIRTTLSGLSDYDNDGYCGFEIVEAREIDSIGTAGIIKKIRER
ncbi:MAG: hypothetical protein L6R42_005332, partial [Xanthoria sp. 1 TBL-2021]